MTEPKGWHDCRVPSVEERQSELRLVRSGARGHVDVPRLVLIALFNGAIRAWLKPGDRVRVVIPHWLDPEQHMPSVVSYYRERNWQLTEIAWDTYVLGDVPDPH